MLLNLTIRSEEAWLGGPSLLASNYSCLEQRYPDGTGSHPYCDCCRFYAFADWHKSHRLQPWQQDRPRAAPISLKSDWDCSDTDSSSRVPILWNVWASCWVGHIWINPHCILAAYGGHNSFIAWRIVTKRLWSWQRYFTVHRDKHLQHYFVAVLLPQISSKQWRSRIWRMCYRTLPFPAHQTK